MNGFEKLGVLGDGAFGIVIKCRDRQTNELVAIKQMKQTYSSFNDCLELKEVKSLRKIKSNNVEKLKRIFREDGHFYLVFELLSCSLLHSINHRTKPFTNSEVRFIIHQILDGLQAVHKQGFFHRDIKPDNLLWSSDGLLKIADFGLAREIRSLPPYTQYTGTRWYRAPEIILHHEYYNSPVDIWSVGAIMAELYLLRPLFQGTSEADQLFKIIAVLGTPTQLNWPDGLRLATKQGVRLPQCSPAKFSSMIPDASEDAIELIEWMLQYDPSKRPSAVQALNHRFFNGESTPYIANEEPPERSQSSAQNNVAASLLSKVSFESIAESASQMDNPIPKYAYSEKSVASQTLPRNKGHGPVIRLEIGGGQFGTKKGKKRILGQFKDIQRMASTEQNSDAESLFDSSKSSGQM